MLLDIWLALFLIPSTIRLTPLQQKRFSKASRTVKKLKFVSFCKYRNYDNTKVTESQKIIFEHEKKVTFCIRIVNLCDSLQSTVLHTTHPHIQHTRTLTLCGLSFH